MKLPTVDGDYGVADVLIAEYQRRFDYADAAAEFAKMHLWLSEHPSRRPTMRGILRFVETWFNKIRVPEHAKIMPTAKAQDLLAHIPPSLPLSERSSKESFRERWYRDRKIEYQPPPLINCPPFACIGRVTR